MKYIEISGKIDAETLQRIFSKAIGDVSFVKSFKSDNSESLMMCGAKFFFRTNDTIGFVFHTFYDGRSMKIDFGRVGGGSGLMNIKWGAGNKIENEIASAIIQTAESTGLTASES
ncbi:MAG: hypothetical protein M1460_02075 [Candidatus Thermoplasmatota archaeon]|jgi:hypothetical protein|nr:hypothetical protein [Candidatus Thermoplasmatota archaeon]